MIPDDIKIFLVMVISDPHASEYFRMQATILLKKYTQAVGPKEFKGTLYGRPIYESKTNLGAGDLELSTWDELVP